MLEALPEISVTAESLQAMRSFQLGGPFEPSGQVTFEDHEVPEHRGSGPDVVVRVHRPVGIEGPLPAIFAIHGGGYVLGTYASDDARFDVWCAKQRCIGVAVEYRLAPETPYP